MDIVEMVMATEEAFEIDIPDHEAEKLVTAGNLYDCVMAKLSEREAKIDRALVFARLRTIIFHQVGVAEHQIHHGARFVEDLCMD